MAVKLIGGYDRYNRWMEDIDRFVLHTNNTIHVIYHLWQFV